MHDGVAESISRIAELDFSQGLLIKMIRITLLEVKATQHPYGFYIWRLPWDNSCWQLRIHMWLPEERLRQEPDWPVHSHSGRLHSFVLEGVVSNEDFYFHQQQDGAGAIYQVSYEGQISVLKKTELRGSVRSASKYSITAGGRYFVERDQFHASDVDAGSTSVTLVLMEKGRVTYSHVFGDAAGPSRLEFDRRTATQFDASEVTDLLAGCLKL